LPKAADVWSRVIRHIWAYRDAGPSSTRDTNGRDTVTSPHPFVRLCEAADLDPDQVAELFPTEPYRAAEWVVDRWRSTHPWQRPEPGLIHTATLAEDYVDALAG
jgi:hypothetical protein